MMEKLKNKKKLLIIAGAVIGGLCLIYVGISCFFLNRFTFRTKIDGVGCTGKTVTAVKKAIEKKAGSYVLTLKERDGEEETISAKDIEITVNFDDSIEKKLEEQNPWLWFVDVFKAKNHTIEAAIQYDEQKLLEEISALKAMNTTDADKPVDAYIICENGEYKVVDAVYGKTVEEETLVNAVKKAITGLTESLDMDKKKCYVDPQYTQESEAVVKAMEQITTMLKTSLTYKFGSATEVLDASVIKDWITVGENFEVSLSQDKVKEYVTKLGNTYNTAGKSREFKTTYGPVVTISKGTYGWKINRDSEIEELNNLIAQGSVSEREPVYTQTAASRQDNDYGNSYVEINLTTQHLYLYKDGSLVLETDFVSGNPNKKGCETPVGIYGIMYTQKGAVLKGDNYATPVDYWMPFYGNYGMHDANWRSSFGGTIYQRNGSHGCVNLPPAVAAKIFGVVSKGFPVILYKLEVEKPETTTPAENPTEAPGEDVEPNVDITDQNANDVVDQTTNQDTNTDTNTDTSSDKQVVSVIESNTQTDTQTDTQQSDSSTGQSTETNTTQNTGDTAQNTDAQNQSDTGTSAN